MSAPPFCVGRDVATAQRDMAVRPSGERGAVANDAPGMAGRVVRLQAVQPRLMVLEATGGDQRAVVAALAAAALPVVVVNPRQVRDGAKATGQLATTDALDARAVAHVAEAVRPTPRPLPEAQTAERRALGARHRHLIAMRTAEHNRLGGASGRLRVAIQAQLTGLAQRLVALDDDVDPLRRARPVGRERAELYRRVPGIGPVWARTLGLDLPELGTRHRQRRAALGGVAPVNRDRGTLRGRRPIWGGRAPGRAVRSMRTWVAGKHNPGLTAFSVRFCAAGTATQVALTACMRTLLTILNAMVTQPTPWQPREGSIASKSPLDPGPSRQLLRSCVAPAIGGA